MPAEFEGVSTPDPERLALLESARVPSTLAAVAEAIAEASKYQVLIHVELLEQGWRWSIAHRGGPYPLLRETARFLKVDYHRLHLPFRQVAPGIAGLNVGQVEPLASAQLKFTKPADAKRVATRLRRHSAFAPHL